MVEGSRLPPWVEGVALLAVGREFCCNMVRIRRCIIVLFVAGETIRPGIPEILGCMTVGTVESRVAKHQREEVVIESGTIPLKCCYKMAVCTIFRKSCLCVVRVGRRHEIVSVTVNAVNTQYVKPDRILSFVALDTICSPVRPEQRKPAHPVDPGYVVDKP
jgi:hypothetical protein